MSINRILIHYGEIALKGRNRPVFQRCLVDNIARRLRASGLAWEVTREHHRVLVEVPANETKRLPEALEALHDVAGVVWFAPAVFLPRITAAERCNGSGVDEITCPLLAMAQEQFVAGAGFAVRVKRLDKNYPLRSQDLERALGSRVIEQTDWSEVDLDHPGLVLHVDIDTKGIYVYSDRHEGVGGLPVGTAGRVTALLSGGLDSPVAVYLAAKRGCEVDCVHFTATRMQQADAKIYKVAALVQQLSRVAMHTRLWLVPYLHFDAVLTAHGADYGLVLFRRFMMRVARQIASDSGAQALVTGDNLCQVASQTLENLATTTRSVDMPILRPLITYDKQEIMALARHIGTYDLSIQPYKDCCALVDRHPRTKSRHEDLERIEHEAFPDYAAIVQRSLEDALVLEYDCGK